MKSLVPTGLLLGALLLAGCTSTPSSRINQDRDVYTTYPMEVQEKIAAGQVGIGFTNEQVRMALGAPDRVSSRTDPDGTSQVWSYRERKSRVGFGVGLGIGGGGGSTRVGTGIGVSTGGRDYDDEGTRVIFDPNGQVRAVEQVQSTR